MVKGLYHWAVVCGMTGLDGGFEAQPLPWQTATVFFAVIDLVAAVGLWLAAAWGAVVWLTACVSMAAVEVIFPQVYGGRHGRGDFRGRCCCSAICSSRYNRHASIRSELCAGEGRDETS